MSEYALGQAIKNYRRTQGVKQVRLAALVGISQPYLSAIENGKRTPTSISLLLKICEEIGVDPTTVGLEENLVDTQDIDFLYETGVSLMASGDQTSAELVFADIVNNPDHQKSLRATRSEFTFFRAKWRLANIMRDRQQLAGPSGASRAFDECLDFFATRGFHSFAMEAQLSRGACLEMTDNLPAARVAYETLSKMTGGRNLVWARAENRISVLDMKEHDLESAEQRSGEAEVVAVNGDSEATYSFIVEKRALILAKKGELDQARTKSLSAAAAILPGDSLRRVQNLQVQAEIAAAQHDVAEAERLLERAITLAKRKEFNHQLRVAQRTLTGILNASPSGRGTQAPHQAS